MGPAVVIDCTAPKQQPETDLLLAFSCACGYITIRLIMDITLAFVS